MEFDVQGAIVALAIAVISLYVVVYYLGESTRKLEDAVKKEIKEIDVSRKWTATAIYLVEERLLSAIERRASKADDPASNRDFPSKNDADVIAPVGCDVEPVDADEQEKQ